VRSGLLVAEVALALVLVIGAGLMIRSFLRLQQVNPGFNPNNLLMLSVSLPGARYPEDRHAIAFFDQAEQRIKALPGVVEVGSTNVPALKGAGYTNDMTIEGRPPEDYIREIRHKTITADYFRAMGIQLLGGRFLVCGFCLVVNHVVVAAQSPRLLYSATLGNSSNDLRNPNGVAAGPHAIDGLNSISDEDRRGLIRWVGCTLGAQPLGVGELAALFPRVAEYGNPGLEDKSRRGKTPNYEPRNMEGQ